MKKENNFEKCLGERVQVLEEPLRISSIEIFADTNIFLKCKINNTDCCNSKGADVSH